MARKLTAEEEHKADRIFSKWKIAMGAVHSAEKEFGKGSSAHAKALATAGKLWNEYKKLRPTDSKKRIK